MGLILNGHTPEIIKFNNANIEAIKFNGVAVWNSFPEGIVTEFQLTNNISIYEIEHTGWYILETWGAQGASAQGAIASTKDGNESVPGLLGDYDEGLKYLYKGDRLYICVGGMGQRGYYLHDLQNLPAGYNASGLGRTSSDGTSDRSHWGSSSGGTHIATKTGLTSELTAADILVSARAGDSSRGGVGWPPELYTITYYGQSGGGCAGSGTDSITNVESYGSIIKKSIAGARSGNGFARITTFKAS